MLTMEECCSFTPPLSLCTFLGLGHSPSEEFPTECTKFQFLRGKKFKMGKNAKKKKSLKNAHKSCFWHFRKTAKKYIIKNTYIYLHTNYIYIHTAEPQERLRAGGTSDDSPLTSLPCTHLRQNCTEDWKGLRMAWGI